MSEIEAGSVTDLRMQLRSNVKLRFELLGEIARITRSHGVELSDEALGNLVFVDASEIEEALAGPDLPGGTNF